MKTLKSILFVATVLIIIPLIITFFIITFINSSNKIEIIIYLILYVTLYLVTKKIKLLNLLFFPINFLISYGRFYTIGSILLIHIFLYFGLSFAIPSIVIKLLNLLFQNIINRNVETYITLTSGFVIIVLTNSYVLKIIHKVSPARFEDSEKLRPYRLDLLSNYLFQPDNIRIIIFFIYSTILLKYNISTYNKSDLTPIIQSFISFIAFDRLYSLIKSNKFSFNVFKYKIIKSYLNKASGKNKPF